MELGGIVVLKKVRNFALGFEGGRGVFRGVAQPG